MLSNGIGVTVMPVLAVVEHMPNSILGTIGAIYFAGMFLAYFIGGALIRALGYRRSGFWLFPPMLMGLAVLLSDNGFLWAFGRFLSGFGIGISYMITESWVAGRAHQSIRMTALSIYITAAMLGILLAQALLTSIDPASLTALLLGVLVLIFATAVISLSPAPQKVTHAAERRAGHAARIIRHAVVPLAGVFVSGLSFSIFITFYPAYGADRGLSADIIPMIGVAVMSGSTIMQPLMGRFVERRNPAPLLALSAFVSACAAVGLVMTTDAGFLIYGFVALWGASALTTYPLYGGLAYAALPDESVLDIARAVLVSYGVAEIIAPPLMGMAIDAWGVDWLFGVAAASGLILVALLVVGPRAKRFGSEQAV